MAKKTKNKKKGPSKTGSLTLSEKRKKQDQKKRLKNQNTEIQSPSQQQIDALFVHYQSGRHEEFERLAALMTEEFPAYQIGWKALGAALKQTGRLSESLVPMQRSVELAPHDAEAHNNLGVTLQELGKLGEAEAILRQAIALQSDFAEAYFNLANTLHDADRPDEAKANFKLAIALKPDYPKAYNNLANVFEKLGQAEEAEASCRHAIELDPRFSEAYNSLGLALNKQDKLSEAISAYVEAIKLNPGLTHAYRNLGAVLEKGRFDEAGQHLYPILIDLLVNGNLVLARDIVHAILSLLHHDPLIKDLLAETKKFSEIIEITEVITVLNRLPLLHHLMRICPLPDLRYEKTFVALRRGLLTNLEQIEATSENIYFISTLCLHCFTCEYVFFESDEESALITSLESEIAGTIAQSKQPAIIQILCLGAYRRLHRFDWCEKLGLANQAPDVHLKLVEEPLVEVGIAKAIPVFGRISNTTSLKVRAQYEENPYPRWEKLRVSEQALSIAEIADKVEMRLHSKHIESVSSPHVLIAGCGTGLHPIATASRFTNCQMKAVDLSLASLAFAQRKTTEFGITNIEFCQADILQLSELGQRFDIVESVGVLHHMNDPMAGWEVLTKLLKPNGLMKVGLYSELARRHITQVREDLASLGLPTSEAEIRQARQSLAKSRDQQHQLLTESVDFYNLSTVRDLLFHTQEHLFTLPQIKSCIDKLGLEFCGFEDAGAISKFRTLHGSNADIYDLALWHLLEEYNPRIFAGMYQFWCQKK